MIDIESNIVFWVKYQVIILTTSSFLMKYLSFTKLLITMYRSTSILWTEVKMYNLFWLVDWEDAIHFCTTICACTISAMHCFVGRFMVSSFYSSGKTMTIWKVQWCRIVDLTAYFLQSR